MRLAPHPTRAAALLLLIASPFSRGAAASPAPPSTNEIAAAAQAVPPGGRLRLDGVEVPATSELLSFDLERFEVWSDDAVVVVHSSDGEERLPAPRTRYFRGAVSGESGSRVFVEVREDGVVRGILDRPGDAMYLIDSGAEAATAGEPAALRAERADAVLLKTSGAKPWSCERALAPTVAAASGPLAGAAAGGAIAATGTRTARLAIETDHEYYLKFGNVNAAIDYAAQLLGYASAVYQAETGTDLLVHYIGVWTTAADPWTLESTCGLMEFGRYWNLNQTGVKRTIAHFLSGKATNSGIAWLGVLCSGAFDSALAGITTATCPTVPAPTSNWGGGYGFTGGIDGNFNAQAPTVLWDIYAVMHEIGHNFNSPHSHCYKNIDGNPAPIDECYNGEGLPPVSDPACHAGAQVLPGPAGTGSGTTMSYCHFLGGGLSNISLNFGTGHLFGVAPSREATRMAAHATAAAAGNPACLAPTFFDNGFEEGALVSPGGRWSGKSP